MISSDTYKAVNIFEFEDAREFVCAIFHAKQKRNPRFSLRAWSRQLGFSTPSYLSAILRGTRKLKLHFAEKISDNLQLSKSERERFELLVLTSNAKTESELNMYRSLLGKAQQVRKELRFDIDKFRLIAEWYPLVLLEMFYLSDFTYDVDYFYQRLDASVPKPLIESALLRLQKIGLLEQDENGRWSRTDAVVMFGDGAPSEAVRNHHYQVLEKAKEALANIAASDRDYRGSTFVMNAENYKKAMQLIKRFHRDMRALAGPGQQDQVVRFSTQLFPLTRGITQ